MAMADHVQERDHLQFGLLDAFSGELACRRCSLCIGSMLASTHAKRGVL